MAQQVTTFDDLAAAIPAGVVSLNKPTLTNWCARLANGICVGVVYPYDGGFAVANLHYGGYPLKFTTLADAKRSVEFRNPYIASWDQVEVPQ